MIEDNFIPSSTVKISSQREGQGINCCPAERKTNRFLPIYTPFGSSFLASQQVCPGWLISTQIVPDQVQHCCLLPVRDIIDDMKENSARKGQRQKTQIMRKKTSLVQLVMEQPIILDHMNYIMQVCLIQEYIFQKITYLACCKLCDRKEMLTLGRLKLFSHSKVTLQNMIKLDALSCFSCFFFLPFFLTWKVLLFAQLLQHFYSLRHFVGHKGIILTEMWSERIRKIDFGKPLLALFHEHFVISIVSF